MNQDQGRYVVIFRATIAAHDPRYAAMAGDLRDRALRDFGCRAFHCVTEGDQEIALSYWDDLADIRAWHDDAAHRVAQQFGRDVWYRDYRVDIADIIRRYGKDPA